MSLSVQTLHAEWHAEGLASWVCDQLGHTCIVVCVCVCVDSNSKLVCK